MDSKQESNCVEEKVFYHNFNVKIVFKPFKLILLFIFQRWQTWLNTKECPLICLCSDGHLECQKGYHHWLAILSIP